MTSSEHRNARCLRQGCQWPLWYWQRLEFLIQFSYAWVRRRQCLWPYWFCWRMQMSMHAAATCWLCIFFQKHISSLQIMNLIIAYYLILKKEKQAAKLNWFVQTFSSRTWLLKVKYANKDKYFIINESASAFTYNYKGTEVDFSHQNFARFAIHFIISLKPPIFAQFFVQNLQYITIGLMQNKAPAISNKDFSSKVLGFETPFSTHIIAWR